MAELPPLSDDEDRIGDGRQDGGLGGEEATLIEMYRRREAEPGRQEPKTEAELHQ